MQAGIASAKLLVFRTVTSGDVDDQTRKFNIFLLASIYSIFLCNGNDIFHTNITNHIRLHFPQKMLNIKACIYDH